MNTQGKSIKLRAFTIERINQIKHAGQSYDGVITELLDYYSKHTSKNKNSILDIPQKENDDEETYIT